MELLSSDEVIEQAKKFAPSWVVAEKSIERTYKCKSFKEALLFIGALGVIAEAADHHPDIDVRYSSVRLLLSTHSAGGLTEKDFSLARDIDSFFASFIENQTLGGNKL